MVPGLVAVRGTRGWILHGGRDKNNYPAKDLSQSQCMIPILRNDSPNYEKRLKKVLRTKGYKNAGVQRTLSLPPKTQAKSHTDSVIKQKKTEIEKKVSLQYEPAK